MVLDLHDATDAAQAVMHEFNERRRVFESAMTIVKRCGSRARAFSPPRIERVFFFIATETDAMCDCPQRCLSLVFLRIMLNAQTYHDKYLTDIEHDNVYVTSYFRKIDARRRARGSPTLLPLKKIERLAFVDPYGLRPGKAERVHLTGQTAKLILEMISVTTFLLLDRLFFEALDLVKRHAYMEYTQVRDSGLSFSRANPSVASSDPFGYRLSVRSFFSVGQGLSVLPDKRESPEHVSGDSRRENVKTFRARTFLYLVLRTFIIRRAPFARRLISTRRNLRRRVTTT